MRRILTLLTLVLVFFMWSAMAEEKSVQTASNRKEGDESLDVQFARAHLKLARLNLRRAREANHRIPGLFSAASIERLQLHVAVDEEQLKQCQLEQNADFHEVCIRSAQETLKLARDDVARRRAIHEHSPTTATALDLERAHASQDLARLNLERTQRLDDDGQYALTHLQWQVNQLRHEVLELKVELADRM